MRIIFPRRISPKGLARVLIVISDVYVLLWESYLINNVFMIFSGRTLTSCARCSPRRLLSFQRPRRAIAAVPKSSNDEDLRSYYDHSLAQVAAVHSTGLFQDDRLKYPDAFWTLSREAIHKAQSLVQRIIEAPSQRSELYQVVKNLDRISNTLCSVIDLAELVRNSHPDEEWVKSASEAYEALCEYMNVLNTHVDLDQVSTFFSMPRRR